MSAHILVIEDNPDNGKLVSWILEDEGYDVTCVESGERCLDVLEREAFDLILMDISLPGMSGKETTRRIRTKSATNRIPILALTAHATADEQRGILGSGVDDLLTKPIDDELLIAAVAKHLRR